MGHLRRPFASRTGWPIGSDRNTFDARSASAGNTRRGCWPRRRPRGTRPASLLSWPGWPACPRSARRRTRPPTRAWRPNPAPVAVRPQTRRDNPSAPPLTGANRQPLRPNRRSNRSKVPSRLPSPTRPVSVSCPNQGGRERSSSRSRLTSPSITDRPI